MATPTATFLVQTDPEATICCRGCVPESTFGRSNLAKVSQETSKTCDSQHVPIGEDKTEIERGSYPSTLSTVP